MEPNDQREGGSHPTGKSRFGWIWGVLIALLAIVPYLVFGPQTNNQKDFYGQRLWIPKAAYPFELTDHNGKPLRLKDLRGKAVLMCFGFTHCPDICPTTLSSLNQVYELLPPTDRNRVQVVFISVDPKRDTPEKLKQYVPFFNPTFIGATGSEEQVRKIAHAYGAFFEYVYKPTSVASDYYTVTHSAYTNLIDPSGQLAVIYDYEKLKAPEKIAKDIVKILNQKP